MVVSPCLYSGFPKELPKEAMHGNQKIVQYTIVKNSKSHWYMYITLIVGVKIVGRPHLTDWKTKSCLIIVLKQVEEKVSQILICKVDWQYWPNTAPGQERCAVRSRGSVTYRCCTQALWKAKIQWRSSTTGRF